MLDLLIRTRDMASLPLGERRVVRGLRLWAATRRLNRCPLAAVAPELGSLRAAAHLHLMLEEVGAAWPDPFAVSPICCPRLSHDEALLADMIALGRAEDRPAFDRLLGEMIGDDELERLFLSAMVLARFL